MKFFLAQINPTVGDLEGNAKKIVYAADQARRCSADILLTPELSLWGYPAKDLLLKNGLISVQDVQANYGRDAEDLYSQLQAEKNLRNNFEIITEYEPYGAKNIDELQTREDETEGN